MGGFVSSVSSVNLHGVFAIEQTSPPRIVASGTGVAGYCAQFPWGPDASVQQAGSPNDQIKMFAPAGMDRTGAGYLGLIGKAWPDLRVVRVVGPTAAAASVTLATSAPANCLTIAAKYKGVAGNSITCTVSAASDGDANHFNLLVQVTGASGTTQDFFQNLNISGTGSDVLPTATQLNNTVITGAFAKIAPGRPVNGTFTMTGGVTGTVDAAAYTGTPGTGNSGIAALENDRSCRLVCVDDPGNTARAAVNSALITHAVLKGDRIAILNGDAGLSSSAAIAAVAASRSTRAVYVDGWYYKADDIDGTLRKVPPAALFVSVAANLSPSTSPAWKDPKVGDWMTEISSLELPRGATAGTFTQNGISTIITEEDGGYRFEAAVMTCAPQDPTRQRFTRQRIGDYIATAVTKSLRSSVDAPNVPLIQNALVNAIDRFLAQMKRNASSAPLELPHILDYSMGAVSAANNDTTAAAGQFFIPATIKTSAGMEQIFFMPQFGENVVVQAA